MIPSFDPGNGTLGNILEVKWECSNVDIIVTLDIVYFKLKSLKSGKSLKKRSRKSDISG